MSAPPEKALAEPMITTALTAGSAPAFLMPSKMPGLRTLPRPLTGGLLRVMTATPSRTEYEAASLIAWRSPGGSDDSNLDCGRGSASWNSPLGTESGRHLRGSRRGALSRVVERHGQVRGRSAAQHGA